MRLGETKPPKTSNSTYRILSSPKSRSGFGLPSLITARTRGRRPGGGGHRQIGVLGGWPSKRNFLSLSFLGVDLRPLYRAVNLLKRLSAPKTFDLLNRVSFTTLKCHQEAGRLNHPHLLYQRFPPFPNHSNI